MAQLLRNILRHARVLALVSIFSFGVAAAESFTPYSETSTPPASAKAAAETKKNDAASNPSLKGQNSLKGQDQKSKPASGDYRKPSQPASDDLSDSDSPDKERPRPEAATGENLSAFEKYVQEKSLDIRQFGYGLFAEPPSTFAPVESVPVGPDYVLGPGDEITISIWGRLNGEYTAVVGREGEVNFPLTGIVHLAGLSFEEAKRTLEKELSRYYNISEVKMNVRMGRLRTIRVFVVGRAMRPGSYTLSSLSTLVNALFAAGGPSKIGSMRDIQVKRNGKTVVHFDLYEFLLKGDKINDVRLLPEDVIFVPPAGPLAGISGDVKEPAIYELKGETTVKTLIEMAGGLSEVAFRGRLQIDRIVDSSRKTVLETSLEGLRPEEVRISPGDIVRVFPVAEDANIIKLSGAVQNPGDYGVGEGLTVKELIDLSGGLKYYAYTEDAELTRVNITQGGPVTEKIHINLSKASSGDPAHNVGLKENDYLFVRAVPEWDLYRTVTVAGEVRFPGVYTIKKGETISSLIERAGGYTDKAYLKGAVFTRESVRELQQRQLDESLDRLEREFLYSSVEKIEEALNPEQAKQEQAASAQRKSFIEKLRSAKAKGRISIRLAPLDKFKGMPSDLVLEDGDRLEVPEVPAQVQVIGSVYNQTAFVYRNDSTVSGYLKNAGGLTRQADEDEIYVLKVDGTAVSKREGAAGLSWDSGGNRWIGGGFMSSRLDPGDTIVVPEKAERVVWMREVKDITQILYQIAVTAGVLIVAF